MGLLAVVVAVLSPVLWRITGPRGLRFVYAVGGPPTDISKLPNVAPWNVDVAPGVTLRGIRRAPAQPDGEWILFFHGNDPELLKSGATLLNRMVEKMPDHPGFGTVAYRGFDGSPGTPSPEVLRDDAKVIFRSLGIPPGRVRILAFSFGAPLAIEVAAELSRQGTPPQSVTLLAGAAELVMIPPVAWNKLLRGDRYEIGPELDDVRCPVRLFHGLADSTLPITQSQSLATRLGSRATLVELPAIDHVSILSGDISL